MTRRILFALCLTILAAQSSFAQVIDNEGIQKILADRIDTQHRAVGIVVGVIEPSGTRVISYGTMSKTDKRPVDGDTLFEIGSATKVFTALALADMLEHGEVLLKDPVSKYLPQTVKVPRFNGQEITLEYLVTHTSGLPRLPSNLMPKDPANPYADYTVKQLYDFLSNYQLTREPGKQYEYSNLGAGLLGVALARREGTDYETLVRKHVLEPLGMKDTMITLTPAAKSRLATGHDESLSPVPNWDLPALAGAGALRSTANDLLKLLAAETGIAKQTPLSTAMRRMLAARRPTGVEGLQIAIGWHLYTAPSVPIVWHNGGTGGYRSFIGFDPKRQVGVVVLSNTSTTAGVDDIGRHLLDPAFPLLASARRRTAIAGNPEIFERYVGRYELAPGFAIDVTREGDRLFAQATGQPRAEIFPESAREFFYKVVDAQISFEVEGEGAAKALVLHQNGRDMRAPRTGAAPQAPPAPAEVSVDAAVLDRYVGSYAVTPAFVLSVTREGNRLFVQATAQPKLEVFAKSQAEFFYKAVDAQISFVVDGTGRATSLVLHQGGRDIPAKRVD